MRYSDDTVTSHALASDTTTRQEDGLHPGEVCRFHDVAMNDIGKSGNNLDETSLNTKLAQVLSDISGGSPITGFKLYLY
eukprot:scaffold14825_cov20-Cyclotella_meneghiniana.AAC.6